MSSFRPAAPLAARPRHPLSRRAGYRARSAGPARNAARCAHTAFGSSCMSWWLASPTRCSGVCGPSHALSATVSDGGTSWSSAPAISTTGTRSATRRTSASVGKSS
eukprot:2500175-Prymnesium_polylepis.1